MTSGLYATKLKPRKQKKLFGSPKKKSSFLKKRKTNSQTRSRTVRILKRSFLVDPSLSSAKKERKSIVKGFKKGGRKILRKLI